LNKRTWGGRATGSRRKATAGLGQTNVGLSRQGRQAHRGGSNERGFEDHFDEADLSKEGE